MFTRPSRNSQLPMHVKSSVEIQQNNGFITRIKKNVVKWTIQALTPLSALTQADHNRNTNTRNRY